ncbi:MAG: M42 family peptidase [Candidatus Aenigmarchaeota archaeon]|nr:M42 family peptidase [Candidatus Aenigmarchaeota archaeon]
MALPRNYSIEWDTTHEVRGITTHEVRGISMTLELLKRLVHAHGISGSEEEVRSIIRNEIKPYVDDVQVDSSGNLIAREKGRGEPKVMIAAHMDEVGLMAKRISGSGRIYFSLVGGIEPITLLGQRVHIHAQKKTVHGIVTTSLMNDGNPIIDMPRLEDMYVDTGLDREDLAKTGITIGTVMSLDQELHYLGNEDVIYGKALDDRIGCYILIELAKRLAKGSNELYYVFTVQEEIGLYGAKTSAYTLEPDWAIAVDVINTYEADDARLIGKGPCITVKDAGTVSNKCINEWLLDLAKKNKIPVQLAVSDVGMTDALNISISRGGIPTTSVGVAVKNIHTTVGVARMKDIENTVELLYQLLKSPPKVCLV